MAMDSKRTLAQSQRGLTLIEILIGMAIGMIGMLVLFQVFAVTEGYARNATGSADAQQNGRFALFALERDIRHSGYGISFKGAQGCDVAAGTYATDAFKVVPTQIKTGANSDEIWTLVGDANSLNYGVLKLASASGSGSLKMNSQFGFAVNHKVLVWGASKPCVLGMINTVVSDTELNMTPTLPDTYPADSRVMNWGPSPVLNRYYVDNGTLYAKNIFAPATDPAINIASGVLAIRAQYGKDDGTSASSTPPAYNYVARPEYKPSDGVIDRFDTTAPTTAAGWNQVLSIRLALLVRSEQIDKDPVAGCTATTTQPKWEGGTFDVSADPNWQCFRYQVFQTTVPLRNSIWVTE